MLPLGTSPYVHEKLVIFKVGFYLYPWRSINAPYSNTQKAGNMFNYLPSFR